MKIGYLDGPRLRRALIAAFDHVQRRRAELNRINVFPVPDGDTGTNLALTVSTIADRLRASDHAAIGEVAQVAADAGVVGARGNCGMILSHFLLGFAQELKDRARVSVAEFGEALRGAVEHVYAALERPVEGTIVTVMREAAEEAQTSRTTDFAELMENLLGRSRDALARTPEQLPALRKAGVVDAGGKGFVHLLEGIAAYIHGDPLVALDYAPALEAVPAAAARVEYDVGGEKYRFCAEALVRSDTLPDADAVRAELRSFGDSLIVIRGDGVLKVHVHTNTPEELFDRMRGFGTLVTHKAEDMQVQHGTVERAAASHVQLARRPVSIVTDGACDLPDEVLNAHGIGMVPLYMVFPDRVVRDRIDISATEFLDLLRKGEHPTTSQPPPGAFLDTFARAAVDGEQVLVILLASALSGTFASAEAAARRFHDAPVHLVDSRAVTLGEGLLVLRAAELAELGWTPADIAAELSRIRDQSGMFVTVDTFDRLLASGRVGRGRAWLGSVLDIKPILEISVQGRAVPVDRVRGRANVLPRMLELLAQRIPATARRLRFGIAHVDCPEMVEQVAAALRERFGNRDIITAAATSVLATHVGSGAWAVAYQVED